MAIAGNVFQLDEEGKAIIVGPSTDDANTHLAAEACPTRAIFLYDDQQNQLYPPANEMPRAYIEENPLNNTPANDNNNPDLTKAA